MAIPLDQPLTPGAAVRHTGPRDGDVVVALNGGRARAVPGDWSPSIEWLVRHLADDLPGLGFLEVRYRVKSWRRLDSCIEDGLAAVDAALAAGARRVAMLGFSMGGAVSLACAGVRPVQDVVALAPWIPRELDLGALRGTRVTVLHGSLDAAFPGVPALKPAHSLAGVERMRALGVDASHTVIPGGVHGIALRPLGVLMPLPRAGGWLRLVRAELARFAAGG